MSKLRFAVLGCGSSPGVPRINGDWGACDPNNPKNRRLRCSLLVQRIGPDGITSVVIDTSPDFRQQMLKAKVSSIDAVVYTHPHADHLHGIDDLRGYALVQKSRIPVYADTETHNHLSHAFGYCFSSPEGSMYPPICEAHEIAEGKVFTIEGEGGPITLLPILQIHGPIHSLGFRFGSSTDDILNGGLCYSPDISEIPDSEFDYLKNLDVWILDALQYRPHISHFSVEQALEKIKQFEPKRAILTHMHIPLDFEILLQETPEHVEPAYDGMVIEV